MSSAIFSGCSKCSLSSQTGNAVLTAPISCRLPASSLLIRVGFWDCSVLPFLHASTNACLLWSKSAALQILLQIVVSVAETWKGIQTASQQWSLSWNNRASIYWLGDSRMSSLFILSPFTVLVCPEMTTFECDLWSCIILNQTIGLSGSVLSN